MVSIEFISVNRITVLLFVPDEGNIPMTKIQIFILCVGISFTMAGCGGTFRQGAQSEPVSPDSSNLTSNNPQKETEINVSDESAPGFSTTPSGLKYRIVREGSGKKPSPQDNVTVHYRGTLEDGSEFDSSYKRGKTTSFPLGGVIPGWTEGLQLVSEGGEIELIIPPDLAYGNKQLPGIPAGSTLHFKVELFKVN